MYLKEKPWPLKVYLYLYVEGSKEVIVRLKRVGSGEAGDFLNLRGQKAFPDYLIESSGTLRRKDEAGPQNLRSLAKRLERILNLRVCVWDRKLNFNPITVCTRPSYSLRKHGFLQWSAWNNASDIRPVLQPRDLSASICACKLHCRLL
jgi:hypothetical protein